MRQEAGFECCSLLAAADATTTHRHSDMKGKESGVKTEIELQEDIWNILVIARVYK